MASRRIPSYRCYKPKNLGLVVINGRQHYLGPHGSPESLAEYHRLIQEYLAGVPTPTSGIAPAPEMTINELIVAYWERHVTTYYVKNGRPTSEQDNVRQALRFLRRLYGHTPALGFGPSGLKAVGQAMIDAGRCRALINKDICRIRGLFRWAVENEMVPVAVLEALKAVAGLRQGRSAAKEAEPIGPVPVETVEATLPYLSPQVAAMVRLQLLTGARPGEVTCLRPDDIDRRGGEVWVYRPREPKTEHFDRERVIFLGPRAQEVLRPWLDRPGESFCFSPAEVVASKETSKARSRGARSVRKAAPKRRPGPRYTKDAYRVAVRRACRKAGVTTWSPVQLRHTAATLIRAKYGLEAAQTVLGHSKADVTEIYAERDRARALAVMTEIG